MGCYLSGNSWKNGALHFIGKVKGDAKTGFASWCLKNTNKPDYMNKYQNKQYEMKVASYIDDAQEYVDTIWKKNYGDENFNYLLCVVDDKVIIPSFYSVFALDAKFTKQGIVSKTKSIIIHHLIMILLSVRLSLAN